MYMFCYSAIQWRYPRPTLIPSELGEKFLMLPGKVMNTITATQEKPVNHYYQSNPVNPIKPVSPRMNNFALLIPSATLHSYEFNFLMPEAALPNSADHPE